MNVRYNLLCLSIMMGFGSSMTRVISARQSNSDITLNNRESLADSILKLVNIQSDNKILQKQSILNLINNENQALEYVQNLQRYLKSEQFVNQSMETKDKELADARLLLTLLVQNS